MTQPLVQLTLALFWLMAFSSATHDIAAAALLKIDPAFARRTDAQSAAAR